MEFGIGLLGHYDSWNDAAFAEQHGFRTAGFVDSPLLGGDPFVALGLAAQATTSIRIGTFLAVPSNRSAATTAAAIATVNRIAPGRTFLGIGTGYTSRNVFGQRPVSAATFARYAAECRTLLDGDEATTGGRGGETPYRFRHEPDRYVTTEPGVPIYLAADGAKALDVVGRHGDGWISTLQFSGLMYNSDEVFASSLRTIEAAAVGGTPWRDRYSMLSAGICVLREGESLTSDRVLALMGPLAMLAFHSYADNPAIADYLPPAIRDRLPVYEREVLARFPDGPDRRHQHTHGGHLSYLLPGEAEVLTEDIMRMTTITGTLDEVVGVLGRLEAAGLSNVSLWVPPALVRETILEVEERVMPALASPAVSA